MKKFFFSGLLFCFLIIISACSPKDWSNSQWLAIPNNEGMVLFQIRKDSLQINAFSAEQGGDTVFLFDRVCSLSRNSFGELESGPESIGMGGPYVFVPKSSGELELCFNISTERTCWDLRQVDKAEPLVDKLENLKKMSRTSPKNTGSDPE